MNVQPSEPIPVLVLSDGPSQPSGLGRIARDLTSLLHKHSELLGVRVGQLGFYHDPDTTWPWPVWKILDEGHFGQDDVKRTWWRFAGEKPGVIFTIWDPSRCYGIMQEAESLPVRMWGYFPIDGVNARGGIGGPAGEVLKRYDKAIGYGKWGAEVISRVGGREKVPYLPHGIDLKTFQGPPRTFHGATIPWEKPYVSAVMTNQPRKDLGCLFQAWSLMKQERPDLKFWLHTDIEIRHWSVPELAMVYGLNGPDLTVTTEMSDEELAGLYSQSLVTMLPSGGEGFGYPIVESLACGTPSVAYDGAGGAELIPVKEWRVPAKAVRLEGNYAIERPVFDPQIWARRALWAIDTVEREPEVVAAYCRGAVAHLDWTYLEGRWVSLFRGMLSEVRK